VAGESGRRVRVERYLIGVVADVLRMSTERIEADEEFDRYGVDSIFALQILTALEPTFGPLPKTLFFEYRDIRSLTDYFLAEHRARLEQLLPEPARATVPPAATASGSVTVPPAATASGSVTVPLAGFGPSEATVPAVPGPRPGSGRGSRDVAIIGMSGRYPGARDIAELWENLRSGRDCVTEIPPDRWDHTRYHDPRKGMPGKSYSRWGGFIDGVDEFDPLFFNISPRDADLMDPQIRLYLQAVWHLLEDAGYTTDALRDRYQGRIGVHIGSMYQQYRGLDADASREAVAAISSYSSIANRVSHFFGLTGPSVAVDTMCSSAFTAIHAACKDLLSGDCDLAIAGAVNLSIHPQKYVGLSQLQMIGSTAGSRSFADGDGYLPSEGVGAVLLKPLDRAIADRDGILAVIKGTATGHSGHAAGFGVPDPAAQIRLIRDVLKSAGVEPGGIGYIEAAASGAALGDAVEISALAKVFAGDRAEEDARRPIGSVKAQLGHGEAVSGMAQLAKVVLQMRHRELAATIAPERPNPNLRFDETPFRLVTEAEPWQQPAAGSRRALINAFGAGGSYASLVLEEFDDRSTPTDAVDDTGEPQVVVLSAHDRDRLRAVVELLAEHLGRGGVGLADLAYTTQMGRAALDHRLALVVTSLGELRDGLKSYLAGGGAGAASIDAVPVYSADVLGDRLVAGLLSGTLGESAIAALLAEGDLARVAQLWTHGVDVPWPALHRGRPRRLVHLPAYPFRRDRYWLVDRPEGVASERPEAEHGAPPDPSPIPPPEPPATARPPQEPTASGSGAPPDPDVHRYITGFVANALRMADADITPDRDLRDYGLDSITGRRLLRALTERFQVTITGREFIEHPTVGELADLVTGRCAPVPTTASGNAASEDTITSEYLDRFRAGLMDLDDVKKLITRGDFL
jgi:acyl transferase domain-containing protein